MSAVTYTDKIIHTSKASPAAGKGFFTRLVEAFIAARMEQAERDYARYVQIHGRDPIA